jgi:hypothetical protein
MHTTRVLSLPWLLRAATRFEVPALSCWRERTTAGLLVAPGCCMQQQQGAQVSLGRVTTG